MIFINYIVPLRVFVGDARSLPVVDDTTVGSDDVLAPSLEDELNPLNELFAF